MDKKGRKAPFFSISLEREKINEKLQEKFALKIFSPDSSGKGDEKLVARACGDCRRCSSSPSSLLPPPLSHALAVTCSSSPSFSLLPLLCLVWSLLTPSPSFSFSPSPSSLARGDCCRPSPSLSLLFHACGAHRRPFPFSFILPSSSSLPPLSSPPLPLLLSLLLHPLRPLPLLLNLVLPALHPLHPPHRPFFPHCKLPSPPSSSLPPSSSPSSPPLCPLPLLLCLLSHPLFPLHPSYSPTSPPSAWASTSRLLLPCGAFHAPPEQALDLHEHVISLLVAAHTSLFTVSPAF